MNDENERSVASDVSVGHIPDAARLPACVTGWVPITPEMSFEDGEQWLMAVAVYSPHSAHSSGWSYELSVVTIRCDEAYFSIDCEGEPWDWDLESVDFGVRLSRHNTQDQRRLRRPLHPLVRWRRIEAERGVANDRHKAARR